MKSKTLGGIICLLMSWVIGYESCKENTVYPPITPPDTTWIYLGLGTETITSVGLDPKNSNTIYAGSNFNFEVGTPGRLFKSVDGGKTWDTLFVSPGAQFLGIVVDPNNPQTIYAAPWGVIKSDDGGESWYESDNGIETFPGETHVEVLAMDPFNSDVLYAGTGGPSGGKLYRTKNAGIDWSLIGGDSLDDGVVSFAIDPSNSNVMYAGTSGRGILWKSTDAGQYWVRTGLGTTQGLLYGLSINPHDPNQIFGGSSWAPSGYLAPAVWHGIFRSNDGGMSWQNLNEGLPDSAGVSKIVQEQATGNIYISVSTLYGTSGIYELQSGIGSWTRIGLSVSIVSAQYEYCDLKISGDNQTLYYGGTGIFKLSLK